MRDADRFGEPSRGLSDEFDSYEEYEAYMKELVKRRQYEVVRDKVQRHADPGTPSSVITERIEERLNDDEVGR